MRAAGRTQGDLQLLCTARAWHAAQNWWGAKSPTLQRPNLPLPHASAELDPQEAMLRGSRNWQLP